MREYVHEWRDIHAVWDTPTDPIERAARACRRRSANTSTPRSPHPRGPDRARPRRLTRGLFMLWAADVPIRYSQINATADDRSFALIWLVQVLLLLAALRRPVVLIRRGRWAEAVLLALPLIYVTGVHLPLLCEARQSLPVKPLVLVLGRCLAARTLALALSRAKSLFPWKRRFMKASMSVFHG